MSAHIVIVGGGLAGGTAVETLRDEGFDGEITLVAEEPHLPYQRPPLSKGYLSGAEGTDAVYLHDEEWYTQQRVTLLTGLAATALDVDAHALSVADGSTLHYDRLLLATGASPRSLPIPGHDLAGVRQLRTVDDADALHAELSGGDRRLVLIGSGWIGMEVAATARGFGNEVTVLERDPVPLAAAIGAEMGEVFRRLHLEHGVDLRTSVSVERIDGTERVTGVVVDGETVAADLVLVGVGAVPNTALAEYAGLRLHGGERGGAPGGILVDSALRTSAPDVYAAGDVAASFHPVVQRHLRSEHWANALEGGKVAARSMLGRRAALDAIPYFYSDQYDLGMELSGYPQLMAEADLVVRGDVNAREFVAYWVDRGRIVGGMNVNVWDVNEKVQELIRSGQVVDPAELPG